MEISLKLWKSFFYFALSIAQIGKQMKAKLVILTHFSGRYKLIPLPDEERRTNVGVAFDHATFSFLR